MRDQSSRASRGAFDQVDQWRVPQQPTAQQSADAARRASQTEAKRRQRAKRSRQSCWPIGLLTQLPGLQLEVGQGKFKLKEPLSQLLQQQQAASAVNLLGFPVAYSQVLQQEPSSLSQLSRQPIAPRAGSSGEPPQHANGTSDQQLEPEGAVHEQQSEGMHPQPPKLHGGDSAHQLHPQNDRHDRQQEP
ncbi:TPA: hypothetical protein ACH3X2_003896 [Trebouxia sp. C0005]